MTSCLKNVLQMPSCQTYNTNNTRCPKQCSGSSNFSLRGCTVTMLMKAAIPEDRKNECMTMIRQPTVILEVEVETRRLQDCARCRERGTF